MENQQPTSETRSVQKKVWYKKWWVIVIGLIISYSVGSISLDDAKKKADEAKTKQEQNTQQVVSKTPAGEVEKEPEKQIETNKNPQQILEENITNNIKSVGGSDMDYRSIDISKSDPDRPKNTQMITVSVNIKSFLTKNSLLKDTGKLSSTIFKSVYDVQDIKAHDVIVWYYSNTTDRYGNNKDSVVLSYAIDKVTYQKINWETFDKLKLCEFLGEEAKLTGTMNTACTVLADIK